MRRLIWVCVLLLTVSSGYAQSTATAGGIVVVPPIALPPPVPVSYVTTNSAVDANGNVLILDETLSGILAGSSVSPVAIPTRITVISADGKTVNEYNFTGSFQIVGVGHDAVYAIVNNISISAGSGTSTSTSTATPITFGFTQTLVALHVVAATLPTTLPSVTLSTNQDVKLSAAAGPGNTDVIAIISGNTFLTPVATANATTVNTHVVSLYTSDGTTFTPNPNNPITTH